MSMNGEVSNLENFQGSTARESSSRPTRIVASFFCSFRDESKRQPSAILRSWIAQIVGQNDAAFNSTLDLYREQRSIKASETDLWLLFEKISAEVPELYLVADGFDECVTKSQGYNTHTVSDERTIFLQRLTSCSSQSSNRILFVGRDDADMRFQLLSTTKSIQFSEYEITKQDTREDLALFSDAITKQRLTNKPDVLKREIATEAAKKCDGMFLWIRLLHDRLSPGKNAKQLHEVVANMPPGLDQAYQRDLDRVQTLDKDERERAIAILRWTLFAVRPLTVRELTEALSISLEDASGDKLADCLPDEWDEYYISDQIKKPCGSLINIHAKRADDPPSTRTVSFVHFSVKEYLCQATETIFPKLEATLFSDAAMANDLLAQLCLQYLSYGEFHKARNGVSLVTVKRQLDHYGFLSYAPTLWPVHASSTNVKSKSLLHLINQLFDPATPRWKWWAKIFETGGYRVFGDSDIGSVVRLSTRGTTPLYYAALLGLTDTLETIYQGFRGEIISTKEGQVWTNKQGLRSAAFDEAIQAAAARGHEQAVRFLVEHSARSPYQVEVPSLIFSPEEIWSLPGSISRFVGDILFGPRKRGISVTKEQLDDLITTASFCSRAIESESIIRMCINFGADVRSSTRLGITALHGAARRGALNVINLLLDHDLDVNTSTDKGIYPLHLASQYGHVEAVSLLLKRGADVHRATRQGSGALHFAAASGHGIVVEYLIKAGARTSDLMIDENLFTHNRATAGVTPLQLAVEAGQEEAGQEEAVRFLLRGEAAVDASGTDLYTPLHAAAAAGHNRLVQLLFDAGADLEAPTSLSDPGCWSALYLAAMEGHKLTVDILIGCGAILTPQNDFNCLENASTHQLEQIVEMMIRYKVGINTKYQGYTLLHHATHSDLRATVESLLNIGADIDIPDDFQGQTAVYHAALGGSPPTMRLLLDRGADIHALDKYGRTALHHIVSSQIFEEDEEGEIVKLLLQEGLSIEAQDNDGNSVIHFCARSPTTLPLELVDKYGGNIEAMNNKGQRSLHMAFDNDTMTQAILAHGAFVDPADHNGATPYWYAAKNDIENVMQILKDAGAKVIAKGLTSQTIPNQSLIRKRTKSHSHDADIDSGPCGCNLNDEGKASICIPGC